MNLLPIKLMPLEQNGPTPHWDGLTFKVGESSHNILEYSENLQGWNDNLTVFHEENAGENHFIDLSSRKYTISQIQKFLKIPKPVILEIGCSSGYMLKDLRNAFEDATVIGADIVFQPLVNLAKELPGTPLMRFDINACPLPDNSIDAVVLLNILEHIENDALALRQLFRILKPGGFAIIEVPAGPQLYDIYDKLLLHFRRYSMKSLIQLTESIGFETCNKSHLVFFMYPLFWWVKKKNQRLFSLPEAEQQTIVKNNIQSTRNNFLLNQIIRLELFLGKLLNYPTGIRCLLTIRKPVRG